MSLTITTNIPAIRARMALNKTQTGLQQSLARLSSGFRINQAADDAAGLAISENLKAQIRGLRQAGRNTQDGISMIQTAEGGLNEISSILIRLRELSIQSASDTIGDTERKFLDVEFQQMKSEIGRISEGVNFNGRDLLNGTGGVVDIQVGTNNDQFEDRISFNASAANSTTDALGVTAQGISLKGNAQSSIAVIDSAMISVNAMRANFGAMQNRLQSVYTNIGISEENMSSANSRIRDTDIAYETAEMTKNNILMQSGISVLGQASNIANATLKLLS